MKPRNKGKYRYDLRWRRGGICRIIATKQLIQSPLGPVVSLEREETFVWDHGGMVRASLLGRAPAQPSEEARESYIGRKYLPYGS